MPRFHLTSAVLGTPDPRGLVRFYQQILGWPIRDDDEDWATLRPADGSTGLSCQLEPDHVPPVWPPEPGAEQMQLHLDFEVDDLPAAAAIAEAAGARLLATNDKPDELVRIYADPAGHPFCLWTRVAAGG